MNNEPPEKAQIEQQTHEEVKNEQTSPEEANVPENFEISINYMHNKEKWDQNKVIMCTKCGRMSK